MKCPNCRTDILEDNKSCFHCGQDLDKSEEIYSKAHKTLQPYTPKHLSDNIITNNSFTEGERKLVTVLFADVAGFTAIAEKLDPEEVHQIMDGCFKIIMKEVHEFEGTINQFTGDGVMALFGAPVAQETHAQKACYAAIAIQDAISEYSRELKKHYQFEFKMRIGLNSGPVVVASIGDNLRMDYTAIGDTTNLAARLESIAKPGSIMASRNTYLKARVNFKFKSLGKIDLKGKKDPVAVYKLERKCFRPDTGTERMIHSEMIGRDQDLNRLELQVLKAVNGKGSIVNIIGEAGIGKSRLIAEFKKHEIMNKVLLLEGRAIAMGKNLSFYPIVDILKQWAQIRDADTSIAFENLKAAIMKISPENPDEMLPFIATLMGIPVSDKYQERIKGIEGEALERLITKNLRDLFCYISEKKPLMIVMEDLHWADITSIELLESLFRLSETQPIVFINVFRPGYPETGDRVLETINNKLNVYSIQIWLQPLDKRMSEDLINNILNIKGFDPSLKRRIIDRSDGNPFFIEEVIRSFIDDGLIVIKDGSFIVTDKISSAVIPETIYDVLIARIDRLDEVTRDLVKIASVIGRQFFYRILADIASIENMDKRLAYLEDIQLIRGRERMEELEYLFKHVLAQEAAYESILHQKRKKIHQEVASSIEKIFKQRLRDFYGLLAYHYSKCDNLEKAEEYMIKAGEEAMRSSASNEAINYYMEGLNLYLKKFGEAADPEKLAMFEKNIAIALDNKGKYEESLKYIDSVLKRWDADYPKNRIVKGIFFFLSFINIIRHLYLDSQTSAGKIPDERQNDIYKLKGIKTLALVHLDPKRGFFEMIIDVNASYKLNIEQLDNGYIWRGGPAGQLAITGLSYKLSHKILDISKPLVNPKKKMDLLMYEFFDLSLKWNSGGWKELHEYDRNLIKSGIEIGEFWFVTTFIWVYAFIKIDMGEFDLVHELIAKLVEIWETYEYEIARIYECQLKMDLSLKTRDVVKAAQWADTGISFAIEKGQELHQLYMLGGKALSQIMLQDFHGATESLLLANEILEQKDYITPCYLTSGYLGQFLYDLNQLHNAIYSDNQTNIPKLKKKIARSGKIAKNNANKYAIGRTEFFRMQGQYFWLINKQRKALKCWGKSIKEGAQLSARVELARTYMEIGNHLLKPESKFKTLNKINAETYLEKARLLFNEMNLNWDLDKLDQLYQSAN